MHVDCTGLSCQGVHQRGQELLVRAAYLRNLGAFLLAAICELAGRILAQGCTTATSRGQDAQFSWRAQVHALGTDCYGLIPSSKLQAKHQMACTLVRQPPSLLAARFLPQRTVDTAE